METLSGRRALVTGAGQGVGQGIALALATAGATVAVTGRTRAKLDDTVSQIENRGGRALAVVCNVRDAQALAACVDEVVSALGGLDILVNNAQEVPLGTLATLDDEAFASGWESGPLAVFRLMKLCYPHLKKSRLNGGGSIINLASAAAKRWDMSGYGGYAAIKEATRQLTRAAACEWGPEGIRSNAILPLANSPAMRMWSEARSEEAQAFVTTVPLRRVGDCESDIGRFVVSLCGEGAAYINGQSIGVDGGQVYMG